MNFDQEGVGPFLGELSQSLPAGFEASPAESLTKSIDSLWVEQTGYWEYQIIDNGKAQRLVVIAFKDAVDAPDIAFYSTPEIAAGIKEQLELFAQAQGW